MGARNIAAETREAWRAAAHRYRPWERSTGPRSAAGKATAVVNGKRRQTGTMSYREFFKIAKAIRSELAAIEQFRKDVEANLNRRAD
jgi:hypothetical protein